MPVLFVAAVDHESMCADFQQFAYCQFETRLSANLVGPGSVWRLVDPDCDRQLCDLVDQRSPPRLILLCEVQLSLAAQAEGVQLLAR
jgi:hypothetical protein